MSNKPKGELTIQMLAMPKETNPFGDIFGGWLISQMDIAGGVYCMKVAKGRVATVAIDKMAFEHPVFTGDTVYCYVQKLKTGRTSITVHIEVYVNRKYDFENLVKVTDGVFTYVKIDENRKPIPL